SLGRGGEGARAAPRAPAKGAHRSAGGEDESQRRGAGAAPRLPGLRPLDDMRSVIVVAVLAMGLAGCASSAPAPADVLVPIAGWSRPLCSDTAVAVTSPWDDEVQEVFTELLAAADPEVQRRAPLAVVVHGDGLHLASVCG